MRCRVELPYVDDVRVVLENGRLVLVDVQIVRSREDRHERRETTLWTLAVHAVADVLRFMSADNSEKRVPCEKIVHSFESIEVGAAACRIEEKLLLVRLLMSVVFHGIAPE